MKKLILSLSALTVSLLSFQSFAQDCSGNRYSQPIFTDIDSAVNIKYGSNYKQNGATLEDLYLDVYYPKNDTDTDRPVVLLAHGGSFMAGSRKDLAAMCKNISAMGYVTVSISYRLLTADANVLFNPGPEFKKEVVRAIHDMKAAVRYIRKSYDNNNPYGINPNIIIVGGVSAGAILANHVTFLDSENKVPSDLTAYMTAQGGLEGNSGNPGISSYPAMVLSMCGAIMDTAWVEPGDQPYYGVHTMPDQVVPNLYGQPNVGMTVPVYVYGDSLIYKRTLNVGVNSKYKNYDTGQHCEFGPEYFADMMGFTYQNLCVQGLSTKNNPEKVYFSVYPNPANSNVTIEIPGNQWEATYEVIDLVGKVVYKSTIPSDQILTQLDVTSFPSGIYQIKVNTNDNRTSIKKFIIE